MRRMVSFLAILALALAALALLPGAAAAHRERPAIFPAGTGSVPAYRTTGPYLVVCTRDSAERIARQPKELRKENQALFAECRSRGFSSIQGAVDAVREPGTRILILPGVYTEQHALEPASAECAPLEALATLTYEQHVACPHVQNLIAVLGDGPDEGISCDGRLCGLQIEGTGEHPEDVVIDAAFKRHVALRADRADGVYFRNFSVQHAPDYGIYVLESDGFAIDRVVGRWNDKYGFLTFASDHGLYVDCEAYGNGDSGIYPGASSPQYGARHAIEITRCKSHHNTVGLAGTAGNSLWVHDNDFYDNSTGIALDSVFPNHPGMPQGHSTFEGNRIRSNNQDFYRYYRDGTCAKPSEERGYQAGVVCPTGPVPVGTGFLLAGGNSNEIGANFIWDNWRFGAIQLWAPASIRGNNDPSAAFDTSHFNRYIDNHLGLSPDGATARNGLDFFWDEEGIGNCWDGNTGPGGAAPTSDPGSLPDCSSPPVFSPPNQAKVNAWLPCLRWSPANVDPVGCPWISAPTRP